MLIDNKFNHRFDTPETFFDNRIGLNKETFSLFEAAEYLKILPKSVEYYSRRKGELSYISFNGILVFRKVDLDEFLSKKVVRGIL